MLDAVSVEFLAEPNIRPQPKVMELKQEPSWMDPIIAYLKNSEQPEGKMEAHVLRLKMARYVLYNGKLYKRGHWMPFLKCIPPTEAKYITSEIHEGICGNHTGGWSLVFKTLRQGYY